MTSDEEVNIEFKNTNENDAKKSRELKSILEDSNAPTFSDSIDNEA